MQQVETTWQRSLDKLFTRLSCDCGSELIQKFIKLSSSFTSENFNGTIEPPLIKLLRSIDQRIRFTNNQFIDEVSTIIDLLIEKIDYLLPSNNEFNNFILSPIINFQNSYPFSQMSLSLSSPVAFPEKPSINILKRYFDCDGKLRLKLKLGIFYDDKGKLFWETGFVFPDKSIRQLCKNFCSEYSQMMISGTVLKRIVDNIFEILLQKEDICGIDLTPAHYHILPFSIRLGGKLLDPDSFNKYKLKLFESIDYTFQGELNCKNDLYEYARSQFLLKKKLDTLTVSMLLYKAQLFKKDSSEIFYWVPPRVVITKIQSK